ncbi:MAG: hypothetical protein JO145_16430 [Acidobacteriaceae bacterium]|nr:hypothetical protein [Acidobacteriaceae bacterium]MBV9763879.1 hypothetical protein [Acidobacteriaceae bacterium]
MSKRLALACLLSSALLAAFAQNAPQAQNPPPAQGQGGFKQREEAPPGSSFSVPPGTHVLLNMINSVSTKEAAVGDRIYLETAFPVLSGSRIVIPQGSWVTGTITEVKRPGRVKGRGEIQVRFDSLTLPNGVSRNFRSDLGALDARDNETLKREQSKISGPGNKSGDVGTVIDRTTSGTVIGTGIGAAAGNIARGAGIGAGAGAAAGLLGVLLTRGPDATLSKGSTVEMILDRALTFNEDDLNFANAPPRAALSDGRTPAAPQHRSWVPGIP